MTSISLRSLAAVVITALFSANAATQVQSPLPADKVLASNSRTSVTYAEFEAELARIPPSDVFEFMLDKQRIAKLLENVLVNKTLAIEAREHKLDQLPKAQTEIRVNTDKVLAKYRGLQVQSEVPKVDYLAIARENYLAYPEKTTLPEQYDTWHVLVSTKGRTVEQAKVRIADIRKRLLAGESRESLAQTLSDDVSSIDNQGNLGPRDLSKFDPRFAQEVRTLKIGEVSQVFETSFGFHIVKLLGYVPSKRFSFDETKADLIDEAKTQHVRTIWAEYLSRIQNDPKIEVDTQALDAIRPKLPEIPKQSPASPATGAVKSGIKP